MSVNTILKEYRKKHELTQQELADKLGVTNITVSRLESGRQTVLSPSMAKKIAQLLDRSDLNMFDEHDPQDLQILTLFRAWGNKLSPPKAVISDRWKNDDNLLQLLDQKMQQIGFSTVDQPLELPRGDVNFVLRHRRLYYNASIEKYWAIASIYNPTSGQLTSFRDEFLSALGCACIDGRLNKVSIIIDGDYTTDVYTERPVFAEPQRIPCDFSLLFSDIDGNIRIEQNISSFTDGTGLFDMDSPDINVRDRAASVYFKWNQQVLKN